METSLSLAIYPEYVKKEEVERMAKAYKFAKAINFDGGAITVNRWPHSKTYHGVYGNPGLATVEKGEAYLKVLIEKIADFLIKFDKGDYNTTGEDGVPIIYGQ
jgi:creatinine amidohydrolase/Fe(II)-dependent formamide hydrolase-like protein